MEGERDRWLLLFLLVLSAVGHASYLLGVVVFGPKERTSTMKKASLEMSRIAWCSPKFMLFGSELMDVGEIEAGLSGRKVEITLRQAVFPAEFTLEGHRCFQDLDPHKPADRELFANGLYEWGLGSRWEAIDLEVAQNSLSREHGLPLFRLIRFSLSSPTAMDLASILNAHNLYTWSTGIYQVGFCVYLGLRHGMMDVMWMPLCIALVGLCITLSNVCLDLPSRLASRARMESENRSIKQKYQNELGIVEKDIDAEREALEVKMKERCREECFAGTVSTDDVLCFPDCPHTNSLAAGEAELEKRRERAVQSRARSAELEIVGHHRFRANQAAIAGIALSSSSPRIPMDVAVANNKVIDKKINAVMDNWKNEVQSMDMAKEGSQDRLDAITKDMQTQIAKLSPYRKVLPASLLGDMRCGGAHLPSRHSESDHEHDATEMLHEP